MSQDYRCLICGYHTTHPTPRELGEVRGNTARFCISMFRLWQCPECHSIHSVDPVNFRDIYADYPLNKRRLDLYARGTLGNLVRRLRRAGLKKTASILDYGCGNGVFLQYLKEQGYQRSAGYDPYVPDFANLPQASVLYDWVVANDVIEHCENPRALMHDCVELIKPGGFLYIGMPEPEGVDDMADLKRHIMRLHQPYHRVIMPLGRLLALGEELGLAFVASYRRSYMDTLIPFSNYRFLDEFSKALGHNMDLMLDPAARRVILRHPSLLFYALFGYFFPSAYEPAALWRKPVKS